MTLAHRARLLLRRAGVDVSRYPGSRPERRRALLLAHYGVDAVIDVGANVGNYASELREFGYSGDIYSFEPLSAPFQRLARRAAEDERWHVQRCALGSSTADIDINVAGNDAASSSVLPMLDLHRTAAPESRFIGVETVPQKRLDDVVRDLGITSSGVFVKIDVQGYEKAVLDGAADVLDSALGVQLELSFVPLYEGGLLYDEAMALLADRGFELVSLDPGFTDSRTGRLLQADGVFFRRQ